MRRSRARGGSTLGGQLSRDFAQDQGPPWTCSNSGTLTRLSRRREGPMPGGDDGSRRTSDGRESPGAAEGSVTGEPQAPQGAGAGPRRQAGRGGRRRARASVRRGGRGRGPAGLSSAAIARQTGPRTGSRESNGPNSHRRRGAAQGLDPDLGGEERRPAADDREPPHRRDARADERT